MKKKEKEEDVEEEENKMIDQSWCQNRCKQS